MQTKRPIIKNRSSMIEASKEANIMKPKLKGKRMITILTTQDANA